MTGTIGTHNDLHSEQGALRGEHPGRSRNPIDQGRRPGLARVREAGPGPRRGVRPRVRFHHREADGRRAAAARHRRRRAVCDRAPRRPVALRGAAFRAADEVDVLRLADATGTTAKPLPESLGGLTVDLVDPSGVLVRVVAGTHELPALHRSATAHLQRRPRLARTNATQRPPRVPAKVQRLGHVVLQTTTYLETLNWYLHNLGSDRQRLHVLPGPA